jgi:hypothetical protein
VRCDHFDLAHHRQRGGSRAPRGARVRGGAPARLLRRHTERARGRSTFLRYLGSKEEAALGGLAVYGERLAQRVIERPDAESPWQALRMAMTALSETQQSDATNALALATLVHADSALYKSRWQPQLLWRPVLVDALVTRAPSLSGLAAESLAAAALGCLDAATDAWMATGGSAAFDSILDEAFDAVGAAL